MEYWQDLYHELEQQKERGLREGKKEGMIEGAQQAFIGSILAFGVLFMIIGIFKEGMEDSQSKQVQDLFLTIYHMLLVATGFFLLIRAHFSNKAEDGNLSLKDARTYGTIYAYRKNLSLQKDHYQAIWTALVVLFNATIYWIASILSTVVGGEDVFKNEIFASALMFILNIVFIIGSGAVKDRW